MFKESAAFDDCFELNGATTTVDRDMLDKAHYMLRPLMLRRIKSKPKQSGPNSVLQWNLD